MLKFTLKYLIFVPKCFGPFGPSSGILHWAWLKLHFCRDSQQNYIIISNTVLWQHVVCVLSAVQRLPCYIYQKDEREHPEKFHNSSSSFFPPVTIKLSPLTTHRSPCELKGLTLLEVVSRWLLRAKASIPS